MTQYYRIEGWDTPSADVEMEYWGNPYPRATASAFSSFHVGRVSVEVKDGAGKVVLSVVLTGDDPVRALETAPGEPGTWTVAVSKAATPGRLSFHMVSAL